MIYKFTLEKESTQKKETALKLIEIILPSKIDLTTWKNQLIFEL